ncbi:hypothetical protein LSCM4_01646 [Leishmania orientalis]|uniref:Uncharacterized protein n=1 Tax=Leishmania orientalis TaxID=2249476 RepID=A0A836GX98_9TRYP|nr:hypothetical protein LSCM4_01646 [Leishmania orientalis]
MRVYSSLRGPLQACHLMPCPAARALQPCCRHRNYGSTRKIWPNASLSDCVSGLHSCASACIGSVLSRRAASSPLFATPRWRSSRRNFTRSSLRFCWRCAGRTSLLCSCAISCSTVGPCTVISVAWPRRPIRYPTQRDGAELHMKKTEMSLFEVIFLFFFSPQPRALVHLFSRILAFDTHTHTHIHICVYVCMPARVKPQKKKRAGAKAMTGKRHNLLLQTARIPCHRFIMDHQSLYAMTHVPTRFPDVHHHPEPSQQRSCSKHAPSRALLAAPSHLSLCRRRPLWGNAKKNASLSLPSPPPPPRLPLTSPLFASFFVGGQWPDRVVRINDE